MKNTIVLLVHLLAGLAVLLGTGRTRAVLAESILLKQQLLVLQRSRRRAPNLGAADRFLFGFCSQFLSPRRLIRTAIILKPATLLRFHRGFKDFKYRFLYSSSPRKAPGPKGPSPELIQAICELKRRNPRFGCPKIAQHLAKTFGIDIDKDVLRRVLVAHYRPERRDNGPSWLTLLGHTKDSLWSLDLFRIQSILLSSHWSSWISLPAGSSALACRPWPSTVQHSAACSSRPSPGRVCPRGSVPIMIRCSGSTAGRSIRASWAWKRCHRCPKFPGPIHLSNGSSQPSAGSIWIVCSFGLQMTWNESWSCSNTTATRLACTKGYPVTRPGRMRAAQHLSQSALKITVGKTIATDCLNCQSPREWQFAMDRGSILRFFGAGYFLIDFFKLYQMVVFESVFSPQRNLRAELLWG